VADTATQDQEKLYDPQIAPYIDAESDEVTQIGPDGKRHPISELTGEEQSATRRVEAGEQKRGEAVGDKPGETSSVGQGDKPSGDDAKAPGSQAKAAGPGK
jgi:hypothetical protein